MASKKKANTNLKVEQMPDGAQDEVNEKPNATGNPAHVTKEQHDELLAKYQELNEKHSTLEEDKAEIANWYETLLTKFQDQEVTISGLRQSLASNGTGVSLSDHEALEAKYEAEQNKTELLTKQISTQADKHAEALATISKLETAGKIRGVGTLGAVAIDALCGLTPKVGDMEPRQVVTLGAKVDGGQGKKSVILTTIIGDTIHVSDMPGKSIKTRDGENVLINV